MADEPAGGGEPTTGGDQPAAERTFTEQQVNKLVQDRLAREQKKYEGFEDLQTKAKQFDELQDRQKSELQKAQERAERVEKRSEERVRQANGRLIEAAVRVEGMKHQAIRPEHLSKLIDRSNVTVDNDGHVTGVEDAVKAFLEANPEYVGSTRPIGNADLGARAGAGTGAVTTASFDDVIRRRAVG